MLAVVHRLLLRIRALEIKVTDSQRAYQAGFFGVVLVCLS